MNMKPVLSTLLISIIIFSCDTKATLEIKSNVKDAEVLINQKSVGAAPITVTVESGETTIRLKKAGYKDYITKLALESGDRKVLTANLKAIASVTLEVSANIDGAEVFLNNKLIGKTPLTKKITPGTAKVSVRMEGYKNYNQSVNQTANTKANIDAELITDHDAISAVDEAACCRGDCARRGQAAHRRRAESDGQGLRCHCKHWVRDDCPFPLGDRCHFGDLRPWRNVVVRLRRVRSDGGDGQSRLVCHQPVLGELDAGS